MRWLRHLQAIPADRLSSGRHEFKVAAERWVGVDLGSRCEGEVLAPGQTLALFQEAGFSTGRAFNVVLDLPESGAGEYLFTLDTSVIARPVIVVTQQPVK